MSWSGFRKAMNRAGTQVMLKTGQIEETVDKEYEFEEKRFKTMESASLNLQKELKNYIESLRLLTNSQLTVAEVIDSYYGEIDLHDKQLQADETQYGQRYNNSHDGISKLYLSTIYDIQNDSLLEIEKPFETTVLNPVLRFNSYFLEVNEAIKKRNNKKLDYDSMKSKVKKLSEKPPSNNHQANAETAVKLENLQLQLNSHEMNYQDSNDQLKHELPELVSLRVPFLDPSFESFVKIQLRFFNESFNKLNNLQRYIDHSTKQDYINGELDNKIDDVLMKMRELDITVD